MKINFLTGDLIFREQKTGVNVVHTKIFEKFSADKDIYSVLSFYMSQKNFLSKYGNHKKWHYYMKFSNKLCKKLMYFIPVKWIFGDADIYFCDGIVPVTNKIKICIIHDLMVFRYPDTYSFRVRCFFKFYFWRVKQADKIIAVSQSTKDDIIRYLHIPGDKISVVNLGYESTNKGDFLQEKIAEKYLIYVGAFRENKNLRRAIEGFAQYIKAYNDDTLYFFIVGSGNPTELKKLTKELEIEKKVHFLGYVSDKERDFLYKNAYACLFVSVYEGFGIPILEAMSYGVPVITSNVSSMKEVGENYAILVDPLNIESIAEGIAKLRDEKVRMYYSKKGKQRVSCYSWNKTYQGIKNVFLSALKND